MVCQACSRPAKDSRYCARHEKALQDLHAHHKVWVHAYEKVSWEEFLEKLEGMPETGAWVKEVIKAELKK